jgi:ribosomal-protein-alanine N-acetyltransferase
MRNEDLDEVLAIERQVFPSAWSRASYERELRNANSYYYTARSQGLLLGYVGLWVIVNEAHISTIAVHTDFQRRGIGAHLLQFAIDIARHHGAEVVALEVREGNRPALALYRKFGFQQTGYLPRYYGDTHENGIVMRKALTPKEDGDPV